MDESVREEAASLSKRVLTGEVRAMARAMRWIDDRRTGYREMLKALFPHTGGAYVLGITGMPGAGKSTLVNKLITGYRARGKKVGVIAVDPTSPYSGGAILGDRIRMQKHFLDPGVFIRSLATRGHLGGLSRSAGDVIHVLDAGGYDVILVETVGVGQDELEVTRLAHTTVVVMAPGMGDDIQAIKAGILEIADVFAVNKSDRDGADGTVRDLQQMVSLGHTVKKAGGVQATHGHGQAAELMGLRGGPSTGPAIIKTVATKGDGVEQLIDACEAHRVTLSEGEGRQRLRNRRRNELYGILRDAVLREAEQRVAGGIEVELDRIERREVDPYTVAERLLKAVLRSAPEGET